MTTHDALNERQRRRLAEFDAGVSALMDAPLDEALLFERVEATLRRRRRWRLALPWVAATLLSVFLGPTLWQLFNDVAGLLPGGLFSMDGSTADLLAAIASLPVYVWAVAAGVVLTIGTTLLES